LFVPWLGIPISKRMLLRQKISCSGETNGDGFMIRTVHRHTERIKIWKTDGFAEGIYEGMSNLRLLAILFIMLAISHVFPSFALGSGIAIIGEYSRTVSFGFGLIVTSVLWAFAVILYMLSKGRNFLEYHACEHKIAILIESGLWPTKEVLNKVPKNLYRCGTSMLMSILVYLAVIGAGLVIDNRIVLAIGVTYLALFPCKVILAVMSLAIARQDWPLGKLAFLYSRLVMEISLMLFSFAAVMPLVMEYLFMLREPSEKIAEEGLALAQKIYSEQQQGA